jgi:hypothetical protein
MAAEPGPERTVDGDAFDEGLRAIAHFTDLKRRFTRGHSTGVAILAGGAARRESSASARRSSGTSRGQASSMTSVESR